MERLWKMLNSTLGRKYLVAVTGLALVGFTIGHLAGNLQLLIPDDGHLFNSYAHKLIKLGPILWVIEVILLVIALVHIIAGIAVTITSSKARDVDYKEYQTKGGNSKLNSSSRNMVMFGAALLIFIIVHVLHFKFAAFSETKFWTEYEGVMIRDLYTEVVIAFKNPLWVGFYVFMMAMLGFHLRHGVWSMFQSLGLMQDKKSPQLYAAGAMVGILLAVGFLFLPVFIYIDPFGFYTEIVNQAGNVTEVVSQTKSSH